jgi:hypothetical protein
VRAPPSALPTNRSTDVAIAAGLAWLVLRRDDLGVRETWNLAAVRSAWPGIIVRCFAATVGMIGLVARQWPDQVFDLPRQQPGLWILVMIAPNLRR